ncbi:MAG: hypothetical protein ACI4ON_03220 [Clostridia bacterium]
MNFEEFIRLVSKRFTEEEVFKTRIYDFIDLAIEYAYKVESFGEESEDVEIKYSNCYNY